MMNKPTLLSTGEWLLPVAEWRREGSACVYCSDDRGITWALRGKATVPQEEDRNCDEHMVVELRDGRLWMLVRTAYGIGESVSADCGTSWSPVERSRISHPSSRFFVRRLLSGNILLVKNGPIGVRTERSHLTAFISDDDGVTWKGGLLLDGRNHVAYPDGSQALDGTIHIIYDRDRMGAKEILLARFTEGDVLEHACISATAELRIRVNKASGSDISPLGDT
jgi:predicted neuraminidase